MTPAEVIVEEWRGVPGFDERFEVSSLGRVRRIYDSGGTAIVAQSNSNRAGRMTVSLIPNGSEKRVRRTVARLVLFAFVGEPPGACDKWKALHLNDDVMDNRSGNLRWAEHSESTMRGRGRREAESVQVNPL